MSGLAGLVLRVPDAARARRFYDAVLGAPFPHPVEEGSPAVLPVLPAPVGDVGVEYRVGAGSPMDGVAYVTVQAGGVTPNAQPSSTRPRVNSHPSASRSASESGIAGGRAPATVPMYRVPDVAAAVERVRAAGGTASDPAQQSFGLSADCLDDQGVAFHLGELHGGDDAT